VYIEGANYLRKEEVSLKPRRPLCPGNYGNSFSLGSRDQFFSYSYVGIVHNEDIVAQFTNQTHSITIYMVSTVVGHSAGDLKLPTLGIHKYRILGA
jgi:hypothetical protein